MATPGCRNLGKTVWRRKLLDSLDTGVAPKIALSLGMGPKIFPHTPFSMPFGERLKMRNARSCEGYLTCLAKAKQVRSGGRKPCGARKSHQAYEHVHTANELFRFFPCSLPFPPALRVYFLLQWKMKQELWQARLAHSFSGKHRTAVPISFDNSTFPPDYSTAAVVVVVPNDPLSEPPADANYIIFHPSTTTTTTTLQIFRDPGTGEKYLWSFCSVGPVFRCFSSDTHRVGECL